MGRVKELLRRVLRTCPQEGTEILGRVLKTLLKMRQSALLDQGRRKKTLT